MKGHRASPSVCAYVCVCTCLHMDPCVWRLEDNLGVISEKSSTSFEMVSFIDLEFTVKLDRLTNRALRPSFRSLLHWD